MDATPRRLVVVVFYQVDQLQTSEGARLTDRTRGTRQSPARLKQEEGNKTIISETEIGRGDKTIISETETGRGEQDNYPRDNDRKTGTR